MANKTGLIDKNGKELYFGQTVIIDGYSRIWKAKKSDNGKHYFGNDSTNKIPFSEVNDFKIKGENFECIEYF